jgi:hypothetical protein
MLEPFVLLALRFLYKVPRHNRYSCTLCRPKIQALCQNLKYLITQAHYLKITLRIKDHLCMYNFHFCNKTQTAQLYLFPTDYTSVDWKVYSIIPPTCFV